MKRLPDLLLIVDTTKEATSVKEANTLGIPVMALADTNATPDLIDYIIPGNDDAVRAIKLIISAFADAVLEGQAMRKGDEAAAEEESMPEADSPYYDYEKEGGEADEAYLGASTLAKLRDAKLFEDEEQA
jgi:small subunit ribosomal protein S2